MIIAVDRRARPALNLDLSFGNHIDAGRGEAASGRPAGLAIGADPVFLPQRGAGLSFDNHGREFPGALVIGAKERLRRRAARAAGVSGLAKGERRGKEDRIRRTGIVQCGGEIALLPGRGIAIYRRHGRKHDNIIAALRRRRVRR